MVNKVEFRSNPPARTCTRKYKNYKSYKRYLSADFNNRCGYCDDFDGWIGGESTYHIDHFAPKVKFSYLENEYANLVYACSFCNRFKSDDWPSDDHTVNIVDNKGYIDPCDVNYDICFERDVYGNIVPKNAVSKYMHQKMQLFLTRHRIIWNLTRLKIQLEKLKPLLETHKADKEKYEKIKELYFSLSIEFHDYLNYLLGVKLSNES
ncbi:HNH endonuclease [Brevibacillus invocatus]|uniref:HNH endonuclease n=1 Tax=Brevibacillus invocatus TaxID=173959 RepID=UPI00203DBEF7|nr:HNH endonuclease [Brevibacillus invocatus]MCM3082145.1 HNH endonuclease [Brevibacillus invocatus]MCM3432563.1 HNH endonuclease [Brevibacillus invocatus]